MRCFVVIAALAASPAWAQFKCTDSAGKVAFQQQPCASGTSAKQLQLRTDQNTAGQGNGVAPLDLTGTPTQRMHAVAAAYATLRVLGRECRLVLPIYGMSPQGRGPCLNFFEHASAWRPSADKELKRLLGDREWALEQTAPLGRIVDARVELDALSKEVLSLSQAVRRSEELQGAAR